jgi:hypothetical protein
MQQLTRLPMLRNFSASSLFAAFLQLVFDSGFINSSARCHCQHPKLQALSAKQQAAAAGLQHPLAAQELST